MSPGNRALVAMPYNLKSPNGLLSPCDLADLKAWYADELWQVPSRAERAVRKAVAGNLEAFVRWPKEARLLWPNCNRIPDAGKKQKDHSFPIHLRQMSK